MGVVSVGVPVGLCPLKHIVLDGLQKLAYLCGDLVDGHCDLLMGITANQNRLVVFDISRSDLHTYRDSAHLRLTEFPARALVGIVHLHTEIGEHVLHFQRFFHYALQILADRNDHHLGGSHLRRKHKPLVVAVYHDDGANHTGGHAPGSLVHIF